MHDFRKPKLIKKKTMGKKPKGGDMWDDLLESGDGMLSPSKPKGKRRFRRLKKKKSMLHLDFFVSFMPYYVELAKTTLKITDTRSKNNTSHMMSTNIDNTGRLNVITY